jgi:hypothetical protein
MADEINLSASISFKKGDVSESAKVSGANADVAGSRFLHKVQTIATSYTDLDVTGLTGLSLIFIRNLDSTNFVSISYDGVTDHVEILAGEGYPIRPAGSTIKLKADTAAVNVETMVVEA